MASYHSPYNPEREAEKWVRANFPDGEKTPSTILLLGAGEGFVQRELTKRFPLCRILPIYLRREFSSKKTGDTFLHTGSTTELRKYLNDRIKETDLYGFKILSWNRARTVDKEIFDNLLKDVSLWMERIIKSCGTVRAFGPGWIKNSLNNWADAQVQSIPVNRPKAVVIAGSGPSLSECGPYLSRFRSQFCLIALPSALKALNTWGIKADAAVVTDSGFWTRYHFSQNQDCYEALFMPLTVQDNRIPGRRVYFSQGSHWETLLFETMKTPSLTLPANGTVAGTALHLARLISEGPIYLAGIDMKNSDLKTHVTPHSFDSWITSQTSRTSPEVTIRSIRSGVLNPRSADALRIYEEWFNSVGDRFSPIYRLGGPKNLENLKRVKPRDLKKHLPKETWNGWIWKDTELRPPESRANLLKERLQGFSNERTGVPDCLIIRELYSWASMDNWLKAMHYSRQNDRDKTNEYISAAKKRLKKTADHSLAKDILNDIPL